MEAEILSPTELVVIPQSGVFDLTVPKTKALDFFTTPDAVDPVLAAIRKEIDGFFADVSTAKGRKEIASMAYKISQSKTYLEGVGKELAAAQKEIPKKIDASRKTIRDTLDKWRDEVRAPLTEWEGREEARIGRHKNEIDRMEHAGRDPSDCPSAILKGRLAEIEAIEIGQHLEEFEVDYARAKDGAVARLRAAIAAAEKREAEAAELERLRREAAEREAREREERIAREVAERARIEAERRAQEEIERREAAARAEREAIEARAKAERDEAERREREAALKADQERLAAERRELELKRQAEDAERHAREAVQRARAEVLAEAKRQEAEAAAREANKAHRAKINNAAKAALIAGGLSDGAAQTAVALIAQGSVPRVAISYWKVTTPWA